MIKHVVMMNARSGLDSSKVLAEFRRRLEELPGIITEILSMEVGINSRQSPVSRDLILITTFAGWTELEIYRAHPDHQEVVELMQKTMTDICVVDFVMD